jgi:two-component system, NarL family, response regulator LiaR
MEAPRRISILVVDDHRVLAESLTRLVGEVDDMEIVGTAGTGADALSLAAETMPDVILLDQQLPDTEGVKIAAVLKRELPSSKILILSAFAERDILTRAKEAGCSGYLLKSTRADQLLGAVRAVHQGETQVWPEA